MKTQKNNVLQQHLDSFPVLPATVMRLLQVSRTPECSAKDVVDTIQSDQSLCLTILKIANSALFGRPREADSIRMAVVILGFAEVQRIALAKALVNTFNKLPRKHKPFVDRFWEHSFVSAMAARVIARDLHIAPDIAFMGGLIHDIGKLILLETFADAYDLENWMTALSDKEMLYKELQRFSFTHDILGGQLLKKWSFPENLIAAVTYHHRPEEAMQQRTLAQVIQLADLLAFFCCNPESLGGESITTTVHTSLPQVRSHCHSLGFSLGDNNILEWFSWVSIHRDKRFSLEDAFAA
jgi:putative nucleotidyltransferase with HDIG domain